jgi:hypothetical protein
MASASVVPGGSNRGLRIALAAPRPTHVGESLRTSTEGRYEAGHCNRDGARDRLITVAARRRVINSTPGDDTLRASRSGRDPRSGNDTVYARRSQFVVRAGDDRVRRATAATQRRRWLGFDLGRTARSDLGRLGRRQPLRRWRQATASPATRRGLGLGGSSVDVLFSGWAPTTASSAATATTRCMRSADGKPDVLNCGRGDDTAFVLRSERPTTKLGAASGCSSRSRGTRQNADENGDTDSALTAGSTGRQTPAGSDAAIATGEPRLDRARIRVS